METEGLIPHLFRTEYRKIVSTLCKHFGFEQIEIAEDLASDTFLAAAQVWAMKGMPVNPAAWLYNVAKNKAKNYLQHNHVFEHKIAAAIKNEVSSVDEDEIDLSAENINDSQLQMMFAICHPAISPEAQVGLSLRILCGFGIDEIAEAFLTNKELINKRLFRAKEILREQKIKIELPARAEIDGRLSTVLTTIYLLFNEGYYSAGQNHTIRKELCLEAMRLCNMLVEYEATNKPQVNALLALMCFHASRLDARMNESGELILYEEQDTGLWNGELISKGAYFLSRSASGNRASKYHLEAAIAWWQTQKEDTNEKWEQMLQLHDQLLQIEYSPIAALNRAYALSKVNGKAAAIEAAEQVSLNKHHLYHALLADLYIGIDNAKAMTHLQKAMSLARSAADRAILTRKILLYEQKNTA